MEEQKKYMEEQQQRHKNHTKILKFATTLAQWAQQRQTYQQAVAGRQMTTIYEEILPSNLSSDRRDEVGPPKTKKMKIETTKALKHTLEATTPTPLNTLVDYNKTVPIAPNKTPASIKPTTGDAVFLAFQATVVQALQHVTSDDKERHVIVGNNECSGYHRNCHTHCTSTGNTMSAPVATNKITPPSLKAPAPTTAITKTNPMNDTPTPAQINQDITAHKKRRFLIQ